MGKGKKHINKNNDSWFKLFNKIRDVQMLAQLRGIYDNCIVTNGKLEHVVKPQSSMCYKQLPSDNPAIFAYNMLHLVTELSEVLQEDRRWKSIRKDRPLLNEQNKLEEFADCFICLFNAVVWSGIDADELLTAINKKADIYRTRVYSETEKFKNIASGD